MKRFVALAALLLVAGCGNKVKEGAPCKGDEQVCVDANNALVCRGQTYAAVPCAGPLHCAKATQGHIACDTSLAAEGTACMGEDDEYACAADKKRAFVCKEKRFAGYLDCHGPNGCSMLGRTPTCDASVAAKGDLCKQGSACSEDKQQMLTCRNGVFEVHRYCRGKLACVTKPEGPACDESVSLAGDPCGLPGQIVCSTDGKTELICQGGVYTKSRTCKNACTITTRPGRPIDCN